MNSNKKSQMFNEMIEGYKTNNEILFKHGTRCWMDLETENPFQKECAEYELFFAIKRRYNIWKRGSVDKKVNLRKMYEEAEKMCKLNPVCPYRDEENSFDDISINSNENDNNLYLNDDIDFNKKILNHVLGVIPDENIDIDKDIKDEHFVEKKPIIKRLFNKEQ